MLLSASESCLLSCSIKTGEYSIALCLGYCTMLQDCLLSCRIFSRIDMDSIQPYVNFILLSFLILHRMLLSPSESCLRSHIILFRIDKDSRGFCLGSCTILQDCLESCRILQDSKGSCASLVFAFNLFKKSSCILRK